MSDKFLKGVGVVAVALVAAPLAACLMAYPTKWAVNYLFTPATLMSLFGVAKLTLWKAFVLNFICTGLFKGSSSSSSKS